MVASIHKRLCILLLLLGGCWPSYVCGQFIFRHYGPSEGLSNRYINQILQDDYGFMWVATNHGLFRFDGYRFKGYFAVPGNHSSLPNNRIKSISLDMEGNLWLGCWGGLARLNRRTGILEQVDANFKSGHDKVQFVHCDRKNRVWVATWLGLYVFDLSGNLVGHWRYGKGKNDLPHEQCNSVYEARNGEIWIGTTGGLCRFREKTHDFDVFYDNNPAYTINNGWLNSTGKLWEDSAGTLWFGGWANGLKKFDRVTQDFNSTLLKPEFAGHGAYNVITDLAEFDGRLWVASHDQGLGTFNKMKGQFDFIKHKEYPKLDMPTMLTNALCATADALWIGTANGLYVLHKKDQFIELFPLPGVRKLSCLPEITDIVPDPFNANGLYFSTWTCGLFYYDLQEAEPRSIPDPIVNIYNDINVLHIRRMIFTRDSTHVLATSHGLYYRKPRTSKFVRVPIQRDVKSMPPDGYFYTVFEDSKGVLWAASRNGIIQLNTETFEWKRISLNETREEFTDALNDVVTDICETNDFLVFLRGPSGREQGCGITVMNKVTGALNNYVFGKGSYANYPYPQSAWKIKAYPGSNKVLISSDRGVCVFNIEPQPRFQKYSAYNGLSADEINSMSVDAFGNVCFQSETALDVWNFRDEVFTINAASGLPDKEITAVRPWLQNKVALGFSEYYFALIDFTKGNTPDTSTRQRIKLSSAIAGNTELRLSDTLYLIAGTRYVKLEFSDFAFLRQGPISYSIRRIVNGDTLAYRTDNPQLELTDLDPGFYTFIIETPQSKGVIYIQNPYLWYEKPWLRFLFIAIISSLILLGIFRYQRSVYRKKQRVNQLKLQLVEHEMKSLRTQMNDHFVFNALAGINRFIYEHEPNKATAYLNTFAKLIRQNLKSTRNAQVKLADELSAIQWYTELEGLRLNYPPELKFSIAESIDPEKILIPPMLIQPLVENAIRHGAEPALACITIEIGISKENENSLAIEVIDNGPSFQSQSHDELFQTKGLSLATQIIKERLEIMNEQNTSGKGGFEIFKRTKDNEQLIVSKLILPLSLDKANEKR